MFKDRMQVDVCPNCYSNDYFSYYSGSDGFFTSKRFEHYICNDCNHKFTRTKTTTYVRAEPIREAINDYINEKISLQDMRDRVKKDLLFITPITDKQEYNLKLGCMGFLENNKLNKNTDTKVLDSLHDGIHAKIFLNPAYKEKFDRLLKKKLVLYPRIKND